MAEIQHGDILLQNGSIYGVNGDLANGEGKEQHIGAILNADAGNFRPWPTLGANLTDKLNAPLDSRSIVAYVQNALFLDGWRLTELDINTTTQGIEITVRDAKKVTDNTKGLA